MSLGFKFLQCLNGKFFNFKKIPFRYYGFLVAIGAFLWNCRLRCLYHKDRYKQKLQYKHYNSVLISYLQLWDIFTALLALAIFLLHKVRFQWRYFLSNLATGYTRSIWHARRLSMFPSNKVGGIFSKRSCSVTEQSGNAYI